MTVGLIDLMLYTMHAWYVSLLLKNTIDIILVKRNLLSQWNRFAASIHPFVLKT